MVYAMMEVNKPKYPLEYMTQDQYLKIKQNGVLYKVWPQATGKYKLDVEQKNENKRINKRDGK